MQRLATIALLALCSTGCSNSNDTETEERVSQDNDPYLWLEEVEGERALDWARERNKESLSHLEALETYAELRDRNLEIYNSDDRIATPAIRGEFVYNFWRDAAHVRGLWRRMTIDDYVAGQDDWEPVLDIDALADAEGEDWVWKGAECLYPDYERCLLQLSRGGADATVVREFNMLAKQFVENGFFLEEAKSNVSWIDKNSLFVGSDFGEDALTDSGYPRTVRVWERGEPVEEAEEIFAGDVKDVASGVSRIWDGNTPYDVAVRYPTFFTTQKFLMNEEGEFVELDVPPDSRFSTIFKGQIILELTTDWTPDATTYPQGAVIAIALDDFLAGSRDFEMLFEPTPTRALSRGGIARTRDYVLLSVLDDVVSKLERLSISGDAWASEAVDTPDVGRVSIVSTDENSNLFFFSYESFLQPDTLYVSDDGGATISPIRQLPAYFNSDGMGVEQLFATSRDGTKVPYFLVTPAGFEADGEAPTLIGGYGGFQVSRLPSYSATIGHSWLERGGVYVLANIRGGGEYGPAWHQAALREKRQNAYDDFIAVAEDLVARGITNPDHLGIRGGSNGGLLTGVMLTQRPDLYDAVVVQVPLLDMKRYNKLLAGASWMGEYGDPDTDDWEFIKEYSPYHNLKPDVDYPKAFFTTSTRDDRVHPAHARKMVARMMEMGHDLYYYENMVGGHAGASDNTQAARNEALIYSYLWDQLGDTDD